MSKMHGYSDLHLLFHNSTQFSSRWYLYMHLFHKLRKFKLPSSAACNGGLDGQTAEQNYAVMSHPSRCGTDCDSTINQHPVAMSHPSGCGTDCDSTINQHPVAMSCSSRRGTDCDSTTNQHILKQCPVLQGVGQTVTPLQTNTSWSNVPSFKAWDRLWHLLWLHHSSTPWQHKRTGEDGSLHPADDIAGPTKHQSTFSQLLQWILY